MKSFLRTLIGLSLLAALASCASQSPAPAATDTAPAAAASGETGADEAATSTSVPASESPKVHFRGTRMRLPDMEGLPSNQDLSPTQAAKPDAPLIARPPVE